MSTRSTRRWVTLLVPMLGGLALLAAGLTGWAVPLTPAGLAGADAETSAPRAALQRRPPRGGGGVYKAEITPHWFHNNTRFWYRNDLRGGNREFVVVDAESG